MSPTGDSESSFEVRDGRPIGKESLALEPSQFLEVGGRRFEVAWHGPRPADAPTLVFLHEGLGCVALWRDFPAKLAAATGCGAFVYSRLGYGRSDPCPLPRPSRYLQDEGLRLLPEVLKAAEVRDCVLVGHSDGGSIALVYAGGTAAAPLRGLVTEAAHVFCEEVTVRSIEKARDAYREDGLRGKLLKYHGANVDCAFWGWNGAWLAPDSVRWTIEEYLPGIRVPLLAIQGSDDPYGTPRQLESIARCMGAKARSVLLPGCGHSPHSEQAARTLELMTRFVCETLPRPSARLQGTLAHYEAPRSGG